MSLHAETLGRRPTDFVELKEALAIAGLPSGDIGMTGRTFWRFRDLSGRTIGYGGIELHGPNALLRSIVIMPEARGSGLGGQVVAFLNSYAQLRGVERTWLLTTTAADFFRKLGFNDAKRSRAPDAIKATTEFASLCPASAICMSRALGP
ncbi:MAG TPA: arsenic resistance N-acetyltransferase ArsN2 [Alphaproteobacteria bacterium]|nr:arsenic resistance N-acetyltransferase ArsN2 [Alphaproteobacteria bacterium]